MHKQVYQLLQLLLLHDLELKNMLHEDHLTSAPRATNVSIKTAV
jgi:hypothetical protein